VTRLVLSEAEETPLAAVLETGFDSFNAPFIGEHGYKPLRLMVFREGEETPAGGIQADCYGAWLQVRDVWLPEDLRRSGLGTALFDRIEAEAKARGCIGAFLTTFSFQARPFYEKRGYTCFATLEDNPPGHSRFFMMKRFAAP